MLIMILVLTNSKDFTAHYLCDQFKKNKVKFLRIDTDDFFNKYKFSFSKNKVILHHGGKKFLPDDFSNIWFRRPYSSIKKSDEFHPEKKFILYEYREMLEAFLYNIPQAKWMNHPSNITFASNKINQLSLATKLGLTFPHTIVTQNPKEAIKFKKENQTIVTKVLYSGYIERDLSKKDSLIYTSEVTENHMRKISLVKNSPTIFQKKIKKLFDVRICYVDNKIYSTKLEKKDVNNIQILDIRKDNMRDVSYSKVEIPKNIETKVKSFVKEFNLRFSAIDMVVDENKNWYFLENNPNGQWAWMDIVGKQKIYKLFVDTFR